MLFGVTPLDIATYVGAGAALALVTLAAAYLPAGAPAVLNPLIALRTD